MRRFGGELDDLPSSIKILINRFEIRNAPFGILDLLHGIVLLNYIILERKFFIYRRKLNNSTLYLTSLVAKFKRAFESESFIARENNNLNFHYRKWRPLFPIMEQ